MGILVGLLGAGSLLAQSTEQVEFFEKKVRQIFATKCYGCHGPKTQMGGLNLSMSAEFAKVVSPGDVEHSRLYQAVSYSEKIKMPPAGKLPDQEIADLKSWIESGAGGAPALSWPAIQLPPRAVQTPEDFAPPPGQNRNR